MTIRITPEEYAIADLPGESLQLLDGSGYIGELVVYHELHCIKRIRRHLNMTYYYPGLAGEDIEREKVHIGKLPPHLLPSYHMAFRLLRPSSR